MLVDGDGGLEHINEACFFCDGKGVYGRPCPVCQSPDFDYSNWPCQYCGGKTLIYDVECFVCGGTGLKTWTDQCPSCNGTGSITVADQPCPHSLFEPHYYDGTECEHGSQVEHEVPAEACTHGYITEHKICEHSTDR